MYTVFSFDSLRYRSWKPLKIESYKNGRTMRSRTVFIGAAKELAEFSTYAICFTELPSAA